MAQLGSWFVLLLAVGGAVWFAWWWTYKYSAKRGDSFWLSWGLSEREIEEDAERRRGVFR